MLKSKGEKQVGRLVREVLFEMDIFLEKIVKRRISFLDIALIVLIIILATALSFVAFMFLGPTMSPLIILGVGYLAYFLASKRSIEYEYIVTNGDIDIDMIVSQRKRKRVFSANCKDFELVAPITSSQYTKEIRETKNVKNYSSQNPKADVWFIYRRPGGGGEVILFEPTEQMVDSFRMFIPRKVFKN